MHPHYFFFFFNHMQHKAASLAEGTDVLLVAMSSAGDSRNLEFFHGAGDSSPTLHEGHNGIVHVHKGMLADETPAQHPSEGPFFLLVEEASPSGEASCARCLCLLPPPLPLLVLS